MAQPSFGLFGINMGSLAEPSVMREIALLAESAGFESLWTGEHIVLPDPQAPPSPAAPEVPFVDSTNALSYLAALTERIKLGTGIIILPQRRPVVLAKSLASLDHLSGGRLLFGLGVGYLEPEMTACDSPMSTRGARSDEYLAAMRTIWSTDRASFASRHVLFASVTANPKPVQASIHTIVGGASDAAFRRAVRFGHGWYGFMRDPDQTAADLERIRAAADDTERPDDLGRLEISITPRRRLSAEDLAAYTELGVDRLILQPGGHRTRDELVQFVEESAPHRW